MDDSFLDKEKVAGPQSPKSVPAHTTVCQAARHGDPQTMTTLLKEGHPYDVSDNRGWKAIHEASYGNHYDCLQTLLEIEGTDVNWQCFEGRTALNWACEQGHFEAARILLDHEANPNIPDSCDHYPIFLATRANSQKLVKLLTRHAARVDVQLYCGTTSLHQAAAEGFLDIVTWLLENNAKLDIQEENGITPVFLAAQHGKADCLKALLDKVNESGENKVVDQPAEDGATPLFLAAQEGHTECVRLLLSHRASANIPTTAPVALPLHAALQFQRTVCVQLLTPVTDFRQLSKCDASAFYYSTMHHAGGLELTESLVAAGYDISERHQLLEDDDYEPKVLRYFSDTIKFSKRVTPLTLIGVYKHPIEHARILLEAGAKVDAHTRYELPPILPALDGFNLNLVDLLFQHNCKVNVYHPKLIGNLLLVTCLHNWVSLDTLLRHGAEASTLFLNHSQAIKCDATYPWNPDLPLTTSDRLDQILDDMTEEEGDYENEIGVLKCPVEFWRVIAEARSVMSHRGVHVFSVLFKILQFVGNVTLDPRLLCYVDSSKERNALLELTADPRLLTHLCRITVRTCLTPGHECLAKTVIDNLPLPQPIKEYLSYEEVD